MNNINNPIKIIHKFKNNNRRIQYIQYIYIGSNIDEDIMLILENIKNKDFYDTIDILTKQKIDKLNNYYGDKWYTCFFNRYHLTEQFNSIIKNPNKKKTLENKMGKEWVSFNLSSPLIKKQHILLLQLIMIIYFLEIKLRLLLERLIWILEHMELN